LKRSITGFHQDQESHWVAALDCGHHQHTRHDPPFFQRPWVTTEEGRRLHLGSQLNCILCDRQEIPDGYVPYRRTTTFMSDAIPAGLQSKHSLKAGVWGIIHVLAGRLRYCIHEPLNRETILESGSTAVIIPEVEHEVHPLNGAEFFIEFWGRSAADSGERRLQ
jgi:tellurite methyltransferase